MELTMEEIEPFVEPVIQPEEPLKNAKAKSQAKPAPLKSAMKTPQSAPKPKQSITYDSILENMGLCVYNDTLHELSKKVEEEDQEQTQETKMYPRINKKPRNIPQNGYIYSKFNKSYVQPQAQQAVQPQYQPQPRKQQQPRQAQPMTQAAKEHQQKLIRQIVQNNMAKKQVPQHRSLMISNF
jgi:hypothetical protein